MMKENFIASEQVSSILARFTTFIEAKLYKSGGQTMTIIKTQSNNGIDIQQHAVRSLNENSICIYPKLN